MTDHQFQTQLDEAPPIVKYSVEQLALYQNMRDHQESGTVRWPELDSIARESYLKESYGLVMAMLALGWIHPKLPDNEQKRN